MRRLVIRPGAIGDCILSLPAIAHLRQEYTELWLPGAVTPLFRGMADTVRPISATGIDLVGVGDLPTPASFLAKLNSFDSIVSWYGANRPEFREAMLATTASCQFHPALPPQAYTGHATDFFLEQVGAPLGGIPQIDLGTQARRDAVVIHPFSGSVRKNWLLDRYRDLAARLPYKVEWSAGPEEQLDGATRFDDLLLLGRWIAGARLYIGNDSGITHLAAATGVPSLALFGPTDPEKWAPRGDNATVLRSIQMTQLPVDTVASVACRIISSS